MIWFGWLLWHINHCRLFNVKSCLYIYVKYIWFGWVGFYGISTIVGYLMPNPLYTYIIIIIIIIIMSCCQPGYPWSSLATSPYHSSPPAGLLGYILCPHIDIYYRYILDIYDLVWLGFMALKPGCHSWWISKMQSGRKDTLEERYAIKFCFKLEKNATETYGMLQTAFRPSCMNRAWVFECHKRFKKARESDERCGRSKDVNTPQLIGQRVRVRVTMLRF